MRIVFPLVDGDDGDVCQVRRFWCPKLRSALVGVIRSAWYRLGGSGCMGRIDGLEPLHRAVGELFGSVGLGWGG